MCDERLRTRIREYSCTQYYTVGLCSCPAARTAHWDQSTIEGATAGAGGFGGLIFLIISTDQLTFEALDNSGDADSEFRPCLFGSDPELQVAAFLHQYGIFILVRSQMFIEEITVINSAIVR